MGERYSVVRNPDGTYNVVDDRYGVAIGTGIGPHRAHDLARAANHGEQLRAEEDGWPPYVPESAAEAAYDAGIF